MSESPTKLLKTSRHDSPPRRDFATSVDATALHCHFFLLLNVSDNFLIRFCLCFCFCFCFFLSFFLWSAAAAAAAVSPENSCAGGQRKPRKRKKKNFLTSVTMDTKLRSSNASASVRRLDSLTSHLATPIAPSQRGAGAKSTAASQMLPQRFAGKYALVTGASKGIGAAIAVRLAREGAHVCVVYGRDKAGAERTVSQIVSHGIPRSRTLVLGADMGSAEAIAGLFDSFFEHWPRLDVCIPNAGAILFEKSIQKVLRNGSGLGFQNGLLVIGWRSQAFSMAKSPTKPHSKISIGCGASCSCHRE